MEQIYEKASSIEIRPYKHRLKMISFISLPPCITEGAAPNGADVRQGTHRPVRSPRHGLPVAATRDMDL